MIRRWISLLFATILCILVGGVTHAQDITVVNMIPLDSSGETNQDSEPNLAINPANPLEIAGSAFTPGAGFCEPIWPPFMSLSMAATPGDSTVRCRATPRP